MSNARLLSNFGSSDEQHGQPNILINGDFICTNIEGGSLTFDSNSPNVFCGDIWTIRHPKLAGGTVGYNRQRYADLPPNPPCRVRTGAQFTFSGLTDVTYINQSLELREADFVFNQDNVGSFLIYSEKEIQVSLSLIAGKPGGEYPESSPAVTIPANTWVQFEHVFPARGFSAVPTDYSKITYRIGISGLATSGANPPPNTKVWITNCKLEPGTVRTPYVPLDGALEEQRISFYVQVLRKKIWQWWPAGVLANAAQGYSECIRPLRAAPVVTITNSVIDGNGKFIYTVESANTLGLLWFLKTTTTLSVATGVAADINFKLDARSWS